MGGRTLGQHIQPYSTTGFNPRPRGGTNAARVGGLRPGGRFQSASPWGDERSGRTPGATRSAVSIRVPVGGRTNSRSIPTPRCGCFNPRPRGGTNEQAEQIAALKAEFQSASPWGDELHRSSIQHPSSGRFNPRPRGGTNAYASTQKAVDELFQSASPWGDEPAIHVVKPTTPQFQSASPWGDEPKRPLPLAIGADVSIRVPVGGRTQTGPIPRPLRQVSIRVPVGGRTECVRSLADRPEQFQSASPWGDEPRVVGGMGRASLGFNPRPRGGTNPAAARSQVRSESSFNPRPRGGTNLPIGPGYVLPLKFQSASPWGDEPPSVTPS